MVLGSTQPLTEMSTRNIPEGVKGCQHLRPTTLLPSVSNCLENVKITTTHNLWDFTARYSDSLAFAFAFVV
jgi:hypothetical protein